MLWLKRFFRTVRIHVIPLDSDIRVGDYVIPKEQYESLRTDWFPNGPRKVVKITGAPEYAGGYFVYCDGEGFYINALERCHQ